MFDRSVDWHKVTSMIGDITKGTSMISLRRYAKAEANGDSDMRTFGWDYRRIQAHGQDTQGLAALVGDRQLLEVLTSLAGLDDQFYCYEVDGAKDYAGVARSLLQRFSSMVATTVKLSVADVELGWFLVSLGTSRDVVHWKMSYHGRTTPADVAPWA